MTSHPLLPMPRTNQEISESYALLGRALAYATDFEHNCRTLAHLTDVVSTDNEFSFEVYMLLKSGTLYEKIRSLVSEYSLPKHSEESIHAARKARNNIAHGICIEHEKLLSTESGRLVFRANIMCEMDTLIKGNQLVQDITRIIKQGSKETHGSEIIEYFFAVSEWLDGKN
ncbi:TPA: DUF4145 domain-containing protein [Vibrio parahaemolyticus]|nr:DUF4145 domain-containing protein [Vibrio parahaemolyticus]